MQIQITDYGPKEIMIGESFNTQADGLSTMWLTANEEFQDISAVYLDKELQTFCSEKSASVIIPKELTSSEGQHRIIIKNNQSNEVIDEIVFEVHANKISEMEKSDIKANITRQTIINHARLILKYIDNVESSEKKEELEVLRKNIHHIVNHEKVKDQAAWDHCDRTNTFFSEVEKKKGEEDSDFLRTLHRDWRTRLRILEEYIISAGIRVSRLLARDLKLERSDKKLSLSQEQLKEKRNTNFNKWVKGLLNLDTKLDSNPLSLLVDVTNVCNFKCPMCSSQACNNTNIPTNFLQFDKIESLLETIEVLNIAGTGEPLLYTHIDEFLKTISQYQIEQVEIITNGSLLGKKIDKLSAFTKIGISFDGGNRKTFEALRKGSNFNVILDNIFKVREKYPKKQMQFAVTVSRLNLDEMEEIAKLALQFNIDLLSFAPMHGEDELEFLELKISDQELFKEQKQKVLALTQDKDIKVVFDMSEEFFSENEDVPRIKENIYNHLIGIKSDSIHLSTLEQSADLIDKNILNGYFKTFEFDQPMVADVREHYGKDRNKNSFEKSAEEIKDLITHRTETKDQVKLPYCMAPWTISYINNDGSTRFCCVLGSNETIINKSFEEMWNSDHYQQMRRTMITEVDMPNKCKGCQESFRYGGLDLFTKTVNDYYSDFADGKKPEYITAKDFDRSKLN